jgi:hypothetical protein
MNQELMNMVQLAVNSIPDHVDFGIPDAFAEAFAVLVAAAEREKIDKLFDTDLGCCDDAMGQEALNQMRAAIRARGDTK